MLEPTERAYFSPIPISLVVVLSVLLITTPSCESSTYVLGTLEEASVGGASSGGSAGCRDVGDDCAASVECCSLSCVDDACGDICVADGLTCGADGACCSGGCDNGVCQALNRACFTSGNPCSGNRECCSGLCESGLCSLKSSFCTQEGDICARSEDCCSQTCVLLEGEKVGTCEAAPTGPSFCSSGIAGSLCEDCNDCCSRLCVPFGEHGLSVCALAKGCRQTGELCADDLDCCGGDPDAALPGAGNVTCEKRSDGQWGICRNAVSCSPQGNVCHIQDYACGVSAAANKCCSVDGSDGVCRLDDDGVPRCDGLGSTCQLEGDDCATNGDCCSGRCLPAVDGALHCQQSGACVEAEDPCTATSECCPTMWCLREAGGAFGHCSQEGAVDCVMEGQLCDAGGLACCGGLLCESGQCRGGSQ